MSDPESNPAAHAPTIFLSYASEDRQAARSIGEALRSYGIEVWFDESELGGGDAWDRKIRKQIRECDYFMPLLSAQTEARHEGYFRREWRLAVERTLDMADDHLFLLPIVIDATNQVVAKVPEKFLSVQWLKVPGGQPTPAFEALARRISSGEPAGEEPKTKASPRAPGARRTALAYPDFPKEEPEQKVRFWAHVIGWAGQSLRIAFMRLPRWLRILILVWAAIALLSRGCTDHHDHDESDKMTRAKAEKLKAIADQYQGSPSAANLAKLGTQIAREFADEDSGSATAHRAFLAIPFSAPAGNSAAEKVANSVFAMVYGRVAVERHGRVDLSKEPLPSSDLRAALDRGRANHARYVLCGSIDAAVPAVLTVKIAAVSDGAVSWTKSYPVDGADPAKIAAEVVENVPALGDD